MSQKRKFDQLDSHGLAIYRALMDMDAKDFTQSSSSIFHELVYLIDDQKVQLSSTEDSDMSKLLQLASPAPFGHGSETILDNKVRDAWEIHADRMIPYMNDENKDKNTWDNWIRFYMTLQFDKYKKLVPSGCSVQWKPYKMHIYKEGGHFEAHRDTAHASNHYLTAVVLLPVSHQGGELQLQMKDGTWVNVFTSSNKQEIQCGVFFTDMIHRVTPVTQGYRVAIQLDGYMIRHDDETDDDDDEEEEEKKDSSSSEEEEEESVEPPPLKKQILDHKIISADIKDPLARAIHEWFQAYPNEDSISLMLAHKYTTGDYHLLPGMLKGVDIKLWRSVASTFHCELNQYEEIEYAEMESSTIRARRTCRRSILSQLPNYRFSFSGECWHKHHKSAVFTGNDAEPAQLTYRVFEIRVFCELARQPYQSPVFIPRYVK